MIKEDVDINYEILDNIEYKHIIELTKYFIYIYNNEEKKDLDLLVRRVKSMSPVISNMGYTFDESIWFPDKPELYKDYIEFTVQLNNRMGYLPFRLYLSKGLKQDAIFLSSNMIWSDYE